MNDILSGIPEITDDERNLLKEKIPWEKNLWEDSKFASIKTKINSYLCEQNEKKCSYCQTKIKKGTGNSEVEHIAPQSKYPHFAFVRNNLTTTCHNCNFSKLASEVFYTPEEHINADYHHYPTDTSVFKIVHAIFDKYEDHIEIYKGLFYKPRYKDDMVSEKGVNTIEMCKLYRFHLIEERAEGIIAFEFRKNNGTIPSIIDLCENDVVKIKKTNEIINGYYENKRRDYLKQILDNVETLEDNKIIDFRSLIIKKPNYYPLINKVKTEDIVNYYNSIRDLDGLKQVIEVLKIFNKKRLLKELVRSKIGIDFNNVIELISKVFRPAFEVITESNREQMVKYGEVNKFLKETDEKIELSHIITFENLIKSLEELSNVDKLIKKMPIEISRLLDEIEETDIKGFEHANEDLRANCLVDEVIKLKSIKDIKKDEEVAIAEIHEIINYLCKTNVV